MHATARQANRTAAERMRELGEFAMPAPQRLQQTRDQFSSGKQRLLVIRLA
jgi:hypothetical protein